ncbi:unnamed protein product [Closterium sp. Yama58-4]|nr:unnamed protein product [Closterium sp. Yama58-4]
MNSAASHQSSRSLGASAAPLYPSAPPFPPTASAPPPSAASSTISYPALPLSSARFPPSSPASTDPYSSAPLRMPSQHRPPSSSSAYFPRSPSSASAASSSMNLARNVGRGICASCLAASLFAALLCTSLPLAALLIWRLAPTPFDQTRPLLFDFRQHEPSAVASFLPRPYTLLPPPPQSPASSSASAGAHATSPSASAPTKRFFSAAPPRLLQRNQRYEAVLRLRLPESDHNLALGMFQISAHALSADYAVLSANSQPATLRFRSRPIRALRTAVLAFPLLWGFREEAQRIELRVLRGVEGKVPVAAVRVMLAPKAGAGPGAGLPQIYDAELRLRAVLGGAGGLWLLAWRVILFTVCAAGIFAAPATLHASRYSPVGLAPAAGAALGRPVGDVGGEGAEAGLVGAEEVVGVGVGAGVGEGGEEGASDEEIESLLAAGQQLLQARVRQAVAGGAGLEEEEGEEEEEERGGGETWRPGLRQRRVGVGRAGGQSVAAVPAAPGAPAVVLGAGAAEWDEGESARGGEDEKRVTGR